jgi:hypothetical protein
MAMRYMSVIGYRQMVPVSGDACHASPLHLARLCFPVLRTCNEGRGGHRTPYRQRLVGRGLRAGHLRGYC